MNALSNTNDAAQLPAFAAAHASAPSADDGGKSLAEHLAVLRRRKGLLLAVFALLLAVSILVAMLLPSVYRSTATILIKEQEIPQELVRSTVTSFADERIQVISQQVMTRATLLDLVDRYGLYGKARQRETSEEILDRMRRDIKLTPISAEVTDRRTGSPVKSTIAFSLSYDSEVASNAQKIANELTTLFLNENVKNRQQKAAETTSFLDEELARVNVHMSEVEQKLSAFKRRNQGRTPDLGLSNLVGSERTEADLQRIDRELAFLADRRLLLEGQLADTRPNSPVPMANGQVLQPEERLRALQTQLASAAALYNDTHPDVRRLKREIDNLKTETGWVDDAADREQSLNKLQAQLSQLREKYSEEHPDVVKLKRAYTALEESARSEANKPALGSKRSASRPDNPLYINLKTQIETTGSQMESLRSERKELQERLAQLSTRLSQTPEVEREFLELARDLDSSRARFRELRDKQMQAQVAEQLERSRKAERFTLIEPPIFPERPNRPNRPLIFWLGLALAVAGAVAAVVLRDALDATVSSPRDVVRVLQVPVLAVWPVLPVAVSHRRRRKLWAALFLVTVLSLVLAAATFHHFLMPLDVAWYGLLRRVSNFSN
jgi:polysaccharide biosynthesis transport protein